MLYVIHEAHGKTYVTISNLHLLVLDDVVKHIDNFSPLDNASQKLISLDMPSTLHPLANKLTMS